MSFVGFIDRHGQPVPATVRCPECGWDDVDLPVVRAAPGRTIDATTVAVTCNGCGHEASLDDFTFYYGPEPAQP